MQRYARFGSAATLALFSVVALVAVPLAEQQSAPESQSWVHVQIEGDRDDAQRVALNLPLGAVGAVMALAPRDVLSAEGHLRIAEQHGVSVSDIRTMWREIMAAGDSEFVAVEQEDRTVRVARLGDQIQVRVDGAEESVRVDLPTVVVDALLSGDGDTLNIAAALDELQTLRGDIVRVVENERQIRVWVDDRAEQ